MRFTTIAALGACVLGISAAPVISPQESSLANPTVADDAFSLTPPAAAAVSPRLKRSWREKENDNVEVKDTSIGEEFGDWIGAFPFYFKSACDHHFGRAGCKKYMRELQMQDWEVHKYEDAKADKEAEIKAEKKKIEQKVLEAKRIRFEKQNKDLLEKIRATEGEEAARKEAKKQEKALKKWEKNEKKKAKKQKKKDKKAEKEAKKALEKAKKKAKHPGRALEKRDDEDVQAWDAGISEMDWEMFRQMHELEAKAGKDE